MVRECLQLDGQHDGGLKRHHLGERRQPHPIQPLLHGKSGRLRRVAAYAADIERLERLIVDVPQQRAGWLDPAAIGSSGQGRVEDRVMAQHDDAIGSQGDIHLDRADPEREGAYETRQRVFRPKPARATMAVQLKRTTHGATYKGMKSFWFFFKKEQEESASF